MGDRGLKPGRKGGGRCTGGGSRGGAESGRNRGKLRNIDQYLAIEKVQNRRELNRAGTEIKGYGKVNPPPPPNLLLICKL